MVWTVDWLKKSNLNMSTDLLIMKIIISCPLKVITGPLDFNIHRKILIYNSNLTLRKAMLETFCSTVLKLKIINDTCNLGV